MKILETNFTTNADKSGNNRFIQLRKEGNVALYRREKMEGNLVGFEVFTFKTIQAGASLPGGGTVEETYESYPGGKSFGRNAWSIGGMGAEKRANQLFNELVAGNVDVVVSDIKVADFEDETPVAIPVVRVVSTNGDAKFQPPPEQWKGTQKELAAHLGLTNYKEAYSPLQRWLGAGILKVVGERAAVRGRTAKIFGRV